VKFFLKSIRTRSFWKYALFSGEALGKFFATIGVLWLFMELMDFLSIYTKDKYSKYAIFPIILFSAGFVVFSRRPVMKIAYKIPQKDFVIDVRIADLFDQNADFVISTSTTFDTDMSSGLISPQSLQGQVALRFFQGNTNEIDRQIEQGLASIPFSHRASARGKSKEYPIGTTVKVEGHGRSFYFVAMSRLNDAGTAASTIRDVEDALAHLWAFVANNGELRDIAIPVMGTGRGRIDLPRKKIIERIAQSFADASKTKVFANRLLIIVRPQDAENFGINLFETRDYLARSLHA
jgi:hypothetical protein